jgi:hypothetical protein
MQFALCPQIEDLEKSGKTVRGSAYWKFPQRDAEGQKP